MLVVDLRAQCSNAEMLEWRQYYSRKAQLEELEINKAKKG